MKKLDDKNINIELILKLFEQLNKSTDKIDNELIGLSNIISNMIDILKKSIPNEEIVRMIEKRNEKMEPTQKDVERIYEKCQLHGEDVKGINGSLKTLSTWVKTMITVVLVTFSLLTISYYYTRSSIETMVKKEFNVSELQKNIQNTTANQDYINLRIELEEIKKELIKQKKIDK